MRAGERAIATDDTGQRRHEADSKEPRCCLEAEAVVRSAVAPTVALDEKR
jgi:hypothetical protein